MENGVRLKFENLQQAKSNDQVAFVQLTDMASKRVITIVCDDAMTQQIKMRLCHLPVCHLLLPEVLADQLSAEDYELQICDLDDGQYQTFLVDNVRRTSRKIRLNDAVLLTLISDIPLYISRDLMERQSFAYEENAHSIQIPINTMDVERLEEALRNAVEEENYLLASKLRDEIKKRK